MLENAVWDAARPFGILVLMESLQLVAPHQLDVRAMDNPPDPGPGEVLVRIRAVGICGSDMHFYQEGGICGSPAH